MADMNDTPFGRLARVFADLQQEAFKRLAASDRARVIDDAAHSALLIVNSAAGAVEKSDNPIEYVEAYDTMRRNLVSLMASVYLLGRADVEAKQVGGQEPTVPPQFRDFIDGLRLD